MLPNKATGNRGRMQWVSREVPHLRKNLVFVMYGLGQPPSPRTFVERLVEGAVVSLRGDPEAPANFERNRVPYCAVDCLEDKGCGTTTA